MTVPQAELKETDAGLIPESEGWFVLNAAEGAAGDRLHEALTALAAAQEKRWKTGGAGVKAETFVLRDAAIGPDVRSGLYTVARIVLDAASEAPDDQ